LVTKVKSWLEELLWEPLEEGPEVLRLKGVLYVPGSAKMHIVQAVREVRECC
jgi:G3E family GTPase